MMDLTHLISNPPYMLGKTMQSTGINQPIPDSTTESPTTTVMDPMLLQVTRPNGLVDNSRNESHALDSLKTLNDSEVEAFTNLISDVSVSVDVDSTQPSSTLMTTFGPGGDNHNDILTYQPLTTSDQQATKTPWSQLIQTDFYKDEDKIPEHLIGAIDHRITRTVPDFSRYPPECRCTVIDKLIAVEQIWMFTSKNQLYYLPQINILVIGNREYAGIFHEPNKGYIALGEVIERMMPQYAADLIAFLERSENVDQCALTEQEIGYLEQRQCFSGNTGKTYPLAISLSTLRNMAQYIVMYEGHKPGFDNRIKEVANGNYYRKVLQRHIRCGTCGGIILESIEPEEYVRLGIQDSSSKMDESQCFSVGYILVAGEKFGAFKIDNRIYVSFKDLCQKKVMKLQMLQARLGALRQRPRLAPGVLNNYLNTPEYNVTNTMWIDIANLRCICCMAKCAVGFNADVYGRFATGRFTEHFITNIYGKDDHQSDNAVYTMDPKTFEVIMKKTSMKSSFKPTKTGTDKQKQKSSLKSFELSSKQAVGYESPEKINDSAFFFEKHEESSWSDPNSTFREKTKSSKKETMLKKETKSKSDSPALESGTNLETYVFDDFEGLANFLEKKKSMEKENEGNSKERKKNSKKKDEVKYIPGKTPTFRVKPAERPYSCEKQDKKVACKKTGQIQMTRINDKVVLTINKDTGKEDMEKSKNHSKTTGKKADKKGDNQDEASNAVKNLVSQFDNVSEKIVESSNCNLEQSSLITSLHVETDNGPNNTCSLDGSMNNIFGTPSNLKVVVEKMDSEQSQGFTDSTSPLGQLYQQYEQFEKENNTMSTINVPMVTETELQVRNEQEMPIQSQTPVNNSANSSNMAQQMVGFLDSFTDNGRAMLSLRRSASNRDLNERMQSPERLKRAQTLSPPKNKGILDSPSFARLKRAASLNSPVFMKSGEIDRTHDKVKRLSELENQSQPLDLLASLAEVITEDVTESGIDTSEKGDGQHIMKSNEKETVLNPNEHVTVSKESLTESGTSNQKVGKPVLTSPSPQKNLSTFIADENSNIENGSPKNRDPYDMNEIQTFLQDMVCRMDIEPYKDKESGRWKVRMQMANETRELYPELFADGVDERKRNALLAVIASSFIPPNGNLSNHCSAFSSIQKDKNTTEIRSKQNSTMSLDNTATDLASSEISVSVESCLSSAMNTNSSHEEYDLFDKSPSHKHSKRARKQSSDHSIDTGEEWKGCIDIDSASPQEQQDRKLELNDKSNCNVRKRLRQSKTEHPRKKRQKLK